MTETNIIRDLDANFDYNPINKDLKTLSETKTILQHIEFLLMQDKNALINRPGVCAGLREFIFEPFDDLTINNMKSRIKNSLSFEPRININDIRIFEFDTYGISVEVDFTIISSNKNVTYKSTIRRVI